jgi:L-threonylcarbamoyladenylate synthase
MKILGSDPLAITEAAALLEQGKLVAFPTETVYGLGADAENPSAVAAIYAAKGRPANHPVIVHVAEHADLQRWVQHIPTEAEKLIQAFWPGPLTLILKRSSHIPDAVSGGQDTIGLRCPSHPVALNLLKQFKRGQGGIAAPSANRFGHVSPTSAQHVMTEFSELQADVIAGLIDGGASEVGIESTIVDCSRISTTGIVLLRPGYITAEQIAAVIGLEVKAPDQAAPRVSGALDAHYAPRTPLLLIKQDELQQVIKRLEANQQSFVVMTCGGGQSSFQPAALMTHQLPSDAKAYAHGLYAGLRLLDVKKAQIMLVELPPQDEAWRGVNDRLRRAAFDSLDVLKEIKNNE